MHFPHIRWPRRLYTIFIIPTQACAPRHICSNFNAIFFFFVFFNCIVLMGKSIFCHYGHSKKEKKTRTAHWLQKNLYAKIFELTTTGDNGQLFLLSMVSTTTATTTNIIIIIIKKKKRKAGKNALANKNIFMHVTCFCHVFSMQLCSCFYVFSYPGIYLMARQKD